MNPIEQKKAAKEFVEYWRGRGYEKGETQQFWSDLLSDVVGMLRTSSKCKFEYPAPNGGFIDCLIPDSGVIVEQKSLGVDLDKKELRQGRMVTPFEQALDYAESFPPSQQPRFVIVCNFESFRVHDREACARGKLAETYMAFSLEELATSPHLLDFIVSPENSRSEKEKQVSILAGEKIGRFYSLMREQFIDPDGEESQHALNILCVRIVFCLFCEDADLFPKDGFLNYLRKVEPEDMRAALKRLFRALNTPVSERDPYDEKIKAFPYVNGGLFSEDVEIPNFTQNIKHFLLFELSQTVNWDSISPTIFGGIFESTLNPETRRSGGMHYTSPENIHKVIDPLFLDGLREEFNAIRSEEGVTPKSRKKKLRDFRSKIGSLRFLDPACGSGNFLTETYLCLRDLEDDVLAELNDGQTEIVFDLGSEQSQKDQRVTLDQFYGIEINEFACSVANVALWIAQLQANNNSQVSLSLDIKDFPLIDHATIRCDNALRIDWGDLLPARECNYIMGNPPFLGYSNLNDAQKEDRALLFEDISTVDYVACWYAKASEYTKGYHVRTALVSTNSICQGQQVKPIWDRMFAEGNHIDFCWRSFAWNNEAADQAHVHCVIVGFSREQGTNREIFMEDGTAQIASSINGYLEDKAHVSLERRKKPLCDVLPMVRGCGATDGGNLLLEPGDRDELLTACPDANSWVKPFSMGDEFINGKERYCLWLVGITPEELDAMSPVRNRVERVREMRLASKKAATRKKAETPWLFDEVRPPQGDSYIAIPKVSSEKRNYIPMGFVTNGMIPGDKLFYISDAGLYEFGVLMSRFHNAWMRAVAGRLETRYSYSNTIVYNNFVWPDPTSEQRATIEACAQAVLDARDNHPGKSLADLYDPDKMPADLLAAHKALDAVVEAAYGVDFQGDEEKIVAHLFKLYAEKTKGE